MLPKLAFAALAALTAEAQIPGYTEVWHDEFDGASLDTSRWMYRSDVKMESSQTPRNVELAGGKLIIHLRREEDRGKQYTGGGIISRERFRYGYYEATAQMFGAAGWHQSVWAMFAGDGSTTYPAQMRTEIDGMEFDSDVPWKGHMGLIRWDAPGKSRSLTCSPGVYRGALGFDASAAFHRYGFEWTETKLGFYLDGDKRCVLDYPPDDHMHDRINFWLTAIAYRQLSGGRIDDAALPGRMLVDRASFSVRDLYLDDGDPGYSEQGSWNGSSLPGYSRGGARQACTEGATAEWRVRVPASGTYQLYYFRNPVTGRGRVADRIVEFNNAPAAWVDLGPHDLRAGEDAVVRLERDSGCVAADMIKWVRK